MSWGNSSRSPRIIWNFYPRGDSSGTIIAQTHMELSLTTTIAWRGDSSHIPFFFFSKIGEGIPFRQATNIPSYATAKYFSVSLNYMNWVLNFLWTSVNFSIMLFFNYVIFLFINFDKRYLIWNYTKQKQFNSFWIDFIIDMV